MFSISVIQMYQIITYFGLIYLGFSNAVIFIWCLNNGQPAIHLKVLDTNLRNSVK